MPAGASQPQPLYREVLGPAYNRLPPEIQAMHDFTGTRKVTGQARVERSRNPLCSFIGAILGLPPAGDDVPLTVNFSVEGGREVWRRNFNGRIFKSTQEAGRGKDNGLIIERFGILAFPLRVHTSERGLTLEPAAMRVVGLPIPQIFWPRVDAGETVEDGLFAFDVTLDLPFVGRLVRYRGTLTL